MRALTIGVVLLLSALSASAQSVSPTSTFLVFPDVASAQARSAAMCAALGCDGVLTKFWWSVIPLTNGQAVIEIQVTGNYSTSFTTKGGITSGLSAPELSTVQPFAAIGSLLPAIH